MKKLLAISLLAFAMAPSAFGQGCAMCYESAKGASTKGQNALSRAVMILLFPTLGLMSGIVGLTFIYGGKRDREEDRER